MSMDIQATHRRNLSDSWINFAGVGAEKLADKLGISLDDYIMFNLEELTAFEDLLKE
jgi:hypothetical protein